MKRYASLALVLAACSGTTSHRTTTTRASSAPAPERPIPFRVVDTMPTFWAFWERAEGLEPEEAFAHFEATLLAEHPAIYAAEVLGLGPEEGALRQRFSEWFVTLPPRIDGLRERHAAMPAELEEGARRFMTAIPELEWDGDVYLMVSLDSFNGAGRMVADERALLFGLDVIVAIDGSMPSPVLFAHELFHMHQRMPEEPSMAAATWAEGLATYASHVIVPSACLDEVLPEGHLHDPADPQLTNPDRAISFSEVMPRHEREMAATLLASFDTLDEQDYAAFFLGRAAPRLGERPVRTGYYFGYLAARELAADRSLHELSQLTIEEVEPELRRVLRAIAESGTSLPACAAAGAAPAPSAAARAPRSHFSGRG